MTVRLDGRPHVLLASGLGERTGGGLALLEDGRLEPVDRLSTSGVASRLRRLLLARLRGARAELHLLPLHFQRFPLQVARH